MFVALSFTHQNLMAQSIHPSEVLFQTYHIEVYDLSGRKIIQEHNATFPYDIKNLRKGMYLVHILSENGYSQTEKIVVFE